MVATLGIVEAGVDYISMSLVKEAKHYGIWLSKVADAFALISQAGNDLREGSFRGYDGFWCGGAFMGDRDDGYHIHIPGSWADRVFQGLYHAEAHYSRLDLQCTVRLEPWNIDYAQQEQSNANASNLLLPSNRQREISLRVDNHGGRTLYIGARSSDTFCRLYNKEAQSREEVYTHCWRFEVEAHNTVATKAAAYISSSSRRQASVCASSVWRYFTDRGIRPPYTPEMEETALSSTVQPQTDVERRLRWLRDQVSPCVRRLRRDVPDAILMEALSLGPGAEPLPPTMEAQEGSSQYEPQC